MARRPKPWYRRDKNSWYTTMRGKQIPLGVRDPADEAGAWAALEKLIEGTVSRALAGAKGREGTVSELIPAFLESKRPVVAARTLAGYGKFLEWLTRSFGDALPLSLDLAAVQVTALREKWSDSHRANVLWCVNAFLRFCGRSGDLLRLPPKESRGGDAVIPEAVHKQILLETRGDFRQLVAFLWLTGCRPGEATGLTAEMVDDESRAVRLKRHKTRHKGKSRVLYLSAEAFAILSAQKEKYPEGFLFRGLKGKPFSLQAMTMRFQRVSERVGRVVRSYDYRHSFCTRALAAGESDAVVAALMGHSSTAMIWKHYAHLAAMGRTLTDAAERINRPKAG
jgi:integrase